MVIYAVELISFVDTEIEDMCTLLDLDRIQCRQIVPGKGRLFEFVDTGKDRMASILFGYILYGITMKRADGLKLLIAYLIRG